MQPAELIWNQIAQIHDYLRFLGTQGATWFFFGLGANAAALWAILSSNVSLRRKVVPYAFATFDLLGVIFCFTISFYYHHAAQNIELLTRHLTTEVAANPAGSPASTPPNAPSKQRASDLRRLMNKTGAFSWVLWSVLSCAIGIALAFAAVLWIVYNRDGILFNRKPTK
jgi:hypothetical protein